MKVVLFGATRGMGREVARCLAERGEQIFLLGRDEQALERTARDLEIRGAAGRVEVAHCDLREPSAFSGALERAARALHTFETVIVSAGILEGQERLEQDSAACAELLSLNFTNTILFCEEARRRLLASGGGTLCLFSSVAGERARKSVILYGATKAGLSYYMEGLDHKYHDKGLTTVLVKPGFVKTSMTEGLRPPPFSGQARPSAERVVAAIDGKKSVVFVPAIWWLVMWVIRKIPRAIMRKVGF